MKRRAPRRLMIGVVLAATALMGIAAPGALAGTDGQQVAVVTDNSIHRIQVCGDNQHNTWTCTSIRTWNARAQAIYWLSGWWWKGNIQVRGWTPGNKEITRAGYVLTSQTGNNWVYAYWWS